MADGAAKYTKVGTHYDNGPGTAILLLLQCQAHTIKLSRKHNLLELCENLSYS